MSFVGRERRASMNDATRRRGSLQSACEGTRWAANSLGSVDRVSSLPDVVSRRATLRLHSRRAFRFENYRARPFSRNSRHFCSKKCLECDIKNERKLSNIIVHNSSRFVEDLYLIRLSIKLSVSVKLSSI